MHPPPPAQARQREATAAQMRRDASELQLQDAVTHKSVTDIRKALVAAESDGVDTATLSKAREKVVRMEQAEPSAREERASSQETGQRAVIVEAEEEDRRKKEGAAEGASKKKKKKQETEAVAAPPEAEVREAEQRRSRGTCTCPNSTCTPYAHHMHSQVREGEQREASSAKERAPYELAAAQPGVPVLPGAPRPRSVPLGIKASAVDKKAGKTATSKKGTEPAAASSLDVLRRLTDKEEEEEARQKAAEAVEAERVAEKARKAMAKEERKQAWLAAEAEQKQVVAMAAEIAARQRVEAEEKEARRRVEAETLYAEQERKVAAEQEKRSAVEAARQAAQGQAEGARAQAEEARARTAEAILAAADYYEVLATSGEFSMCGATPGRAVDAEAWALADKVITAVSVEQVCTAAAILTSLLAVDESEAIQPEDRVAAFNGFNAIRKVQEARNVLGDEGRRWLYDAQLSREAAERRRTAARQKDGEAKQLAAARRAEAQAREREEKERLVKARRDDTQREEAARGERAKREKVERAVRSAQEAEQKLADEAERKQAEQERGRQQKAGAATRKMEEKEVAEAARANRLAQEEAARAEAEAAALRRAEEEEARRLEEEAEFRRSFQVAQRSGGDKGGVQQKSTAAARGAAARSKLERAGVAAAARRLLAEQRKPVVLPLADAEAHGAGGGLYPRALLRTDTLRALAAARATELLGPAQFTFCEELEARLELQKACGAATSSGTCPDWRELTEEAIKMGSIAGLAAALATSLGNGQSNLVKVLVEVEAGKVQSVAVPSLPDDMVRTMLRLSSKQLGEASTAVCHLLLSHQLLPPKALPHLPKVLGLAYERLVGDFGRLPFRAVEALCGDGCSAGELRSVCEEQMRWAGGAMHEADVRAGLRQAVLASRPDLLEVLLSLPVVSLTPPQLVERLRASGHVAQLVAPLTGQAGRRHCFLGFSGAAAGGARVAELLQCALPWPALRAGSGWRARLLDPKRHEEVGRRAAEPSVLKAALEGGTRVPCAPSAEPTPKRVRYESVSASAAAAAAIAATPAQGNAAMAERTLRAVEAELERCQGEGERLASEARNDSMVREAKEYMERLGPSIRRRTEYLKVLAEQKKKLEKSKEQIANVLAAEHEGIATALVELTVRPALWGDAEHAAAFKVMGGKLALCWSRFKFGVRVLQAEGHQQPKAALWVGARHARRRQRLLQWWRRGVAARRDPEDYRNAIYSGSAITVARSPACHWLRLLLRGWRAVAMRSVNRWKGPLACTSVRQQPLLLAWQRLLFGHRISIRAKVNSWAQPTVHGADGLSNSWVQPIDSPRRAPHGLSLRRWSQLVLRAWRTVAARHLARGRSEDGLLEAHVIEAERRRATSEVACLKKEKGLAYSAGGVEKEIAEVTADLKERQDSLKNTSKELASHEVLPPPPFPLVSAMRSACHATTATACSHCPTPTRVADYHPSLVITPSLFTTPPWLSLPPWSSPQARVAKKLSADQGKLRAELPQLEKAVATARADCDAHALWHVCRVALASPRPAELLLGGGGALHICIHWSPPMHKVHTHAHTCGRDTVHLTYVCTGVISLTLHLPCSAPAGCMLVPSPDGAGLLVQHVGDGPARVAGLAAGDVVSKAVLKQHAGALLHEAAVRPDAPPDEARAALDALGSMMQLAPDAALREFLTAGPLVFGSDKLIGLPALDQAFRAFCDAKPGRLYAPLSTRGHTACAFAARGLRVVSATPLAEIAQEDEATAARAGQFLTQLGALVVQHAQKIRDLEWQLEGWPCASNLLLCHLKTHRPACSQNEQRCVVCCAAGEEQVLESAEHYEERNGVVQDPGSKLMGWTYLDSRGLRRGPVTHQELHRLWSDGTIDLNNSMYLDAWGHARSWVKLEDLPNLQNALHSYDAQLARVRIEVCRRRLSAGPATLEADRAKMCAAHEKAEASEVASSEKRLLMCSTKRVVGVALAAEVAAGGGRWELGGSGISVTNEPELPEDGAWHQLLVLTVQRPSVLALAVQRQQIGCVELLLRSCAEDDASNPAAQGPLLDLAFSTALRLEHHSSLKLQTQAGDNAELAGVQEIQVRQMQSWEYSRLRTLAEMSVPTSSAAQAELAMRVLRELLRLLPVAELMRWVMGSAPPATLQTLLYGPATEHGRRATVLSSADQTLAAAVSELGLRTDVLSEKLGLSGYGGGSAAAFTMLLGRSRVTAQEDVVVTVTTLFELQRLAAAAEELDLRVSPLLLALSGSGAEGERDTTFRLRQVVVDAIVEAGGTAYAPLPMGGLGPLHLAAVLGRDDVAERLLSSAAVAAADAVSLEPLAVSRPTIMTRSSPLALACANHQSAVGTRLLRTTLDARLKDENRTALLSTALLHAASAFALSSTLELLEAGRDAAAAPQPRELLAPRDADHALWLLVRAGAARATAAASGGPSFAEHALWVEVCEALLDAGAQLFAPSDIAAQAVAAAAARPLATTTVDGHAKEATASAEVPASGAVHTLLACVPWVRWPHGARSQLCALLEEMDAAADAVDERGAERASAASAGGGAEAAALMGAAAGVHACAMCPSAQSTCVARSLLRHGVAFANAKAGEAQQTALHLLAAHGPYTWGVADGFDLVGCRAIEAAKARLAGALKQGRWEENDGSLAEAEGARLDMARALLAHGADWRVRDRGLNTPAHLACAAGSVGMARLLHEGGSRFQLPWRNAKRRTPAELAGGAVLRFLEEERHALAAKRSQLEQAAQASSALLTIDLLLDGAASAAQLLDGCAGCGTAPALEGGGGDDGKPPAAAGSVPASTGTGQPEAASLGGAAPPVSLSGRLPSSASLALQRSLSFGAQGRQVVLTCHSLQQLRLLHAADEAKGARHTPPTPPTHPTTPCPHRTVLRCLPA